MNRSLSRIVVPLLVIALGMSVMISCTSEDQQAVQDKATAARSQVQDAWAGLRTDGDRLVDQIKTHNDSSAKQNLLDSCRNAVEQLRKNENAQADSANDLCNKIRDTDVNAGAAWDSIKSQLDQLNHHLSQ
jgi:hypothetical protein